MARDPAVVLQNLERVSQQDYDPLGRTTRPLTSEAIIQILGDKVRTAIADSLGVLGELELEVGSSHDAPIGGASAVPTVPTATSFTLTMSDTSGHSYAIHGALTMNAHAGGVDLCQNQADQVLIEHDAVNTLTARLVQLQLELQHARLRVQSPIS